MGDVETTYRAYAAAFESAVAKDDWAGLGQYFSPDAIYVDAMGESVGGRDQIVSHLKASVRNLDNKFLSRKLDITEIVVNDSCLTHKWRIVYGHSDLPTMLLEGNTRTMIKDQQIVDMVDELANESRVRLADWLALHGHQLG